MFRAVLHLGVLPTAVGRYLLLCFDAYDRVGRCFVTSFVIACVG